ncbi:ABC-type transport auxiliary lipoprotein family protein [Arenimonas sp. GDDSR-1]|uniref:ABC-type transport auxiliary lipoprotein family protein n=1 Tax=Arenimonas sp. GDDSR-1 TaxID=2950125 RepID=UPI002630381E|nr:ABC-type transport auxiliary lipoprotein family protein [Arenimonas sp. GDDSR-1]
MNKHPLRFMLALAMVLPLAGCISLIKEPDPIAVYALRPQAVDAASLPEVNWSLTVIRPNSVAFLDSNRIAVRPEPNVLQVYKGANWSESLPDLVQANLVQALENSGRIKSVSRQNSGVPAEVAMLVDIRQFESVYAPGARIPDAVIQMHVKVLEYPSNRVIAAQTFNAAIPAASKDIPDVVLAFERGLNTVNADIIAFTLANGRSKAK